MNVSMYVCLYGCMCYLIKHAPPPGHCHNTFMATGALGHTHVQLRVVGFQDSKKAQVNTTATSIIIGTNIHIYIYIYIYMLDFMIYIHIF